jgi:hypothetical protein
MSGSVAAKPTIRPSGDIARIKHYRQNAASGRPYLSSDGATIRYIDHYRSKNANDSISDFYRANNGHALLSVLPRKLAIATIRMDGSFRKIYSSRKRQN